MVLRLHTSVRAIRVARYRARMLSFRTSRFRSLSLIIVGATAVAACGSSASNDADLDPLDATAPADDITNEDPSDDDEATADDEIDDEIGDDDSDGFDDEPAESELDELDDDPDELDDELDSDEPVDDHEDGEADGDDGEDDGEADGDFVDERRDTDALFANIGADEPGCAAAVRHVGGIIEVQYGLADVATGEPITADTIFDIGSVSKQMTAGVIAAQVIEGVLDLDEPVAAFFDGLPAGSESATLSDLVHHTSGLPDYTELLDAELDEVTDADDAIEAVRDAESNFEPGTDFEYSNTNYVLMAELSAKEGGASFVDLSEEYIFGPLQMTATVVRDDQGELLDGQATGYEQLDNGDFEVVSSSWRQIGDGAVHSTPTDVLRWAEVFIAPTSGDDIVGSPEWVELMLQPGEVSDDDTDYAFGLTVDDGQISHSGSWIGYGAYLVIQPDAEAAVAISCNIDGFDTDSLGDALLDIWS